MQASYLKQAILLLVLLITYQYGYALSEIIGAKSKTLEKSYGASSIINETDELLQIQYNMCNYDYNTETYKPFNLKCNSSSTQIVRNSKLNFNLNPPIKVSSNVKRMQAIYIKKISTDKNIANFISDPFDSTEYYDNYVNKKIKGVRKAAFYCVIGTISDVHIYTADGSYICL